MSYQDVTTEKLLDLGAALIFLKEIWTEDPQVPLPVFASVFNELIAIDAELESRQPVTEWPLVEIIYLDGAGVGVEVEHELLEGAEDKLWASI